MYNIYMNFAFIYSFYDTYLLWLWKLNSQKTSWFFEKIRKMIKNDKNYYWWLLVKYYLYKDNKIKNWIIITEMDKKIFWEKNIKNNNYIKRVYNIMKISDDLDEVDYNTSYNSSWEVVKNYKNNNDISDIINYIIRFNNIKN